MAVAAAMAAKPKTKKTDLMVVFFAFLPGLRPPFSARSRRAAACVCVGATIPDCLFVARCVAGGQGVWKLGSFLEPGCSSARTPLRPLGGGVVFV